MWLSSVALLLPLAAAAYDDTLHAAACDVTASDPRLASIVAIDSHGCTGTILARANGQITRPLLITAHHCFGYDTTSASFNLTLRFKALGSCVATESQLADAGAVASSSASMTGTVVARSSDRSLDYILFELQGDLPKGIYYSGWDSALPAVGDRLESLGHSSRKQLTRAVGAVRVNSSTVQSDISVDLDNYTVRDGGSGGALFDTSGNYRMTLQGSGCQQQDSAGACQQQGVRGESLSRRFSVYKPYLDPTSTAVTKASGYYAPGPVALTLGSASETNQVKLTWSTENVTSCEASGSWSGSKSVNGSETVPTTSSGTYTLRCTDGSRSITKSVTASPATPAPAPTPTPSPSPSPAPGGSSGGSGGGSFGLLLLCLLTAAFGIRPFQQSHRMPAATR